MNTTPAGLPMDRATRSRNPTALMFGSFSEADPGGLYRALARGGMQASHRLASDLEGCLLSQAAPSLFVLDVSDPQARDFVGQRDASLRSHAVPLLAVVPYAATATFAEAHELGADGAIACRALGALTRQASSLTQMHSPVDLPMPHGRALIAHPDLTRRRLIGRAVRLAGFDVAFAGTAQKTRAALESDAPPAVAISHRSLMPGCDHEARRFVASQPRTRFLLLPPGASMRAEVEVWRDVLGVALANELTSTANLVFVINELLRSGSDDERSSRRLLYGALVTFRKAGTSQFDQGFNFNISRRGLYVRTLDAPPPGTALWLELRPAGQAAVVHLRGKVVWKRDFGPGAPMPPGFGFRISEPDTPRSDLRQWDLGYAALLRRNREWPECVYLGHVTR